jgi:coenzyme F420 hydrogenase subunit beta
MKTFDALIEEVQKPGLCHHCGGCVTFCTAINYGALELDEDGMPRYADKDKCIQCGLCHAICPEIDELREETRKVAGWTPPMGSVIEVSMARSRDHQVRTKATDGGVVTGLLLHLFDRGHIDGAIVTRQIGPFQREPWLATTREEILDAAGFFIDTSRGMDHFGKGYSTYSPSVQEFRPMVQLGLRRVAMVGTPCQIQAVRKMEALGIVPSDSIRFTLGLFCSGNFFFGDKEQKALETIGGFKWEDVEKINIRDQMSVKLSTGDTVSIPLASLDPMKRYACHYCPDYSAEFADISFGGVGAEEGWTTVVTRTPLGRAIFADARATTLEVFDFSKAVDRPGKMKDHIKDLSAKKRAYSRKMHDDLIQSGLKPQ